MTGTERRRGEAAAGTRATRWKPLLSGPSRDAADEAIEAIARSVCDPRPQPASSLERAYPHSLAYGWAGVALFYAYLGMARRDEENQERARTCLERALAGMGEVPMRPGLFSGFAGVTWVYEHLKDVLWDGGDDSEDPAVAVDSALDRWVAGPSVPPELMHGCGGICIYALERGGQPTARALLGHAVERLQELSRRSPAGCAWALAPRFERLYVTNEERSIREGRGLFTEEDFRRATRAGVFKLGAAHGVAGIAASVAGVAASASLEQDPSEMVRQAARWVLAHELPQRSWSLFPELAGSSVVQHHSGWCNGDLGIAATLFTAAEGIGDDRLRREALRIARLETRRQRAAIESFNRQSPILCHGHAGRAHIFHRFYRATGETLFRDTALAWFEELLALRRPGRGYGGFVVDEDGSEIELHSLLMGSAGVGLALLAATTDTAPAWDRVLGLSLPGGPGVGGS